jgi:hypothetical protein
MPNSSNWSRPLAGVVTTDQESHEDISRVV